MCWCGCAKTSASCAKATDLITALDVPAPLAALGGTLQTPTLDGLRSDRGACGHAAGRGDHAAGTGNANACTRTRNGDLRVVMNVVDPPAPER